jgi:glycosyltransferase involved in cell wall biosynthesis
MLDVAWSMVGHQSMDWADMPGGLRRLMLVGDVRSPHTMRWAQGVASIFDEVLLFSSHRLVEQPREALPANVAILQTSSAMSKARRGSNSRLKGLGADTSPERGAWARTLVHARHVVESTTTRQLTGQVRRKAVNFRPDLIHALRLPWEGIACAPLADEYPVVVSLWGQDLTTQAPSSRLLARESRRALESVSGLTADCEWDVCQALKWGLPSTVPTAVLPGNLGTDIPDSVVSRPHGGPLRLTCPRGVVPHNQWRSLLIAFARFSREILGAELVLLDADQPAVLRLVHRLKLDTSVRVLPRLDEEELRRVAGRTDIVISPTTSDGIPNSVLEFMGQGCFPIVGRLESLGELIDDGRNGFMCDARDPVSIAHAMRRAATDPDLMKRAATLNRALVQTKYGRAAALDVAASFYERVLAAAT